MNKIKVAIHSEGFIKWGGGREFIATIAEGLEAADNIDTILIISRHSRLDKFFELIKELIKSKGNKEKFNQMYDRRMLNQNLLKENESLLIGLFSICSPNTKIVRYTYSSNRFINTRAKRLKECIRTNDIDIILPQFEVLGKNIGVPVVGYLYDFQHKYLKDFFSSEEIEIRDRNFKHQIENSKYLVVNAIDVKNDINKYFPEYKGKAFVLPFKPFQVINIEGETNLEKYNLPEKYYIISNQFWIHKAHNVAFAALEKLFNEGHKDIHLVCTGEMVDRHSPKYIQELMDGLSSLNCKKNIHLLGFVPKKDQLQIMDKAIALIQPTLFEGGPGGGSVYNALCLGVPCIVSDIQVNKEIIGYNNVYFFKVNSVDDLASMMLEHVNDKHLDKGLVEKKIIQNKKEYANELMERLSEIINDYKKNC